MEHTRQPRHGATRRGIVAAGIIAVLGGATLAAAPVHAQARIPAARVPSSALIQTATAANTTGDATHINSAPTDGTPNAVLFVTQDITTGFADNHPYGVYYDGSEWAIFNEDLAPMPVGAQFFVLAFSREGPTDYELTANPAIISGDTAFINNIKTDEKPNAQIQVTQNWDPGHVYNAHNPGVLYDGARWGIINEDQSPMGIGPSFNVLIGSPNPVGSVLALQKASNSNSSGNASSVNNSHSNNDPDALIFVTANYDPRGQGGTYDDSPLSIGYSPVFGKWQVQNRVGSMQVHMAFNLVIYPAD
jgi:hypothetical protein